MDIEILISEIEKRPILWDISNIDYKDRNKKRESWLNVAETVIEAFQQRSDTEKKVIVQDVINKWRSIRDNYVRSLKKQCEIKKLGSAAGKLTHYIYESQLSFLKKCQDARPTVRSFEVNRDQIPNEIEGNNTTKNQIERISNNLSPAHLKCSPQKKKKKIDLEDKVATFPDSRQGSCCNDDEDMAFYKSTLPILKTFNVDQKLQFRIQVLQLLQNIKHFQQIPFSILSSYPHSQNISTKVHHDAIINSNNS